MHAIFCCERAHIVCWAIAIFIGWETDKKGRKIFKGVGRSYGFAKEIWFWIGKGVRAYMCRGGKEIRKIRKL